MSIEVNCRRCGRKAPADEFKVDHVYKLAVCKVCFTEREKNIPKKPKEEPTLKDLMKKQTHSEEKEESYEIKKSKIFDEDEELEKAVKKKQEKIRLEKENYVKTKKLDNTKVLYPCQNCNYKFKYNLDTQRPLVCPYCEKKVNHNIKF